VAAAAIAPGRIEMTTHRGRLELPWTDKGTALLSTGEGKYDHTFADPSDYPTHLPCAV